ncbi:MAG: hypothetical protein ACJKTH_00475 [Patescibacteria group bacterium UBA2163]
MYMIDQERERHLNAMAENAKYGILGLAVSGGSFVGGIYFAGQRAEHLEETHSDDIAFDLNPESLFNDVGDIGGALLLMSAASLLLSGYNVWRSRVHAGKLDL